MVTLSFQEWLAERLRQEGPAMSWLGGGRFRGKTHPTKIPEGGVTPKKCKVFQKVMRTKKKNRGKTKRKVEF